ncbi:MAG: type III-A CRISPR-associated RAMP protein Csm4 [Syntrophomonadaceae bacterium]|nr:type III-A CRISPR-associated RAMP protein Csm4 [Syntrophomonadaceae bacterium]
MRYYMFKLNFSGPVHFGADVPGLGLEKSMMTCHADTLFSALCHEAVYIYGEKGLRYLIEAAEKGGLLLSDLMPYRGEDLYIPRPVVALEAEGKDPSQKKRLKRISHIKVSDVAGYLKFLAGEESSWEPVPPEFGAYELYPRVALSYQSNPRPYMVGTYRFLPDAGLYFIIGLGEEGDLDFYRALIESLGYSGLGGKRTAGCGYFELEDSEYDLSDTEYCYTECEEALARMLKAENSRLFLTLSVICPNDEDMDVLKDSSSTYSLIQRRGFVLSKTYSDRFLKRRPLIMINAGSCFPAKLKGQIVDVSNEGSHPVYRYGLALMAGVEG